MSDLIGYCIYGFAIAGEWLLLPLGLATGWTLYRLAARAHRRNQARRAERHAYYQQLIAQARTRGHAAADRRPGTDADTYATCEAIWNRTEETQ